MRSVRDLGRVSGWVWGRRGVASWNNTYNSVLEQRMTQRRKSREKPPKRPSMPVAAALADLDLNSLPDTRIPSPPPSETDTSESTPTFTTRRRRRVVDVGVALGAEAKSGFPCTGCGAELQSADSTAPGFVDGLRYKRLSRRELRAELCGRCYGLRELKVAMEVTVPTEEYPAALEAIKGEVAMVVLVLDLLDFPCSLWPGIHKVIGSKRPVILVGNKVDLLPADNANYLARVVDVMESTVRNSCGNELNIVHSCAVSGVTLYGLEDLVSVILSKWGNKGNVYILGCRNVGKSTLFNLFMESDLCGVQGSDLLATATVSPFPGTTLNLIKFPMLQCEPWQRAVRSARLFQERRDAVALQQLRRVELVLSREAEYSVPVGHLGQSFVGLSKKKEADHLDANSDLFHVKYGSQARPTTRLPGSLNHSQYRQGRWVYDTPGVVGENQILDDLTLDELEVCVPRSLIKPQSFLLRPGDSLLVGGVVRVDFVGGVNFIRLTLVTSPRLPITVAGIHKASKLYDQELGSEMFGVPFDQSRRHAPFPPLLPTPMTIQGIGIGTSAADIVISTIGWIAVSGRYEERLDLVVHSPGGKGVFLRCPALLPHAVRFRGRKELGKPVYGEARTFIPAVKLN